MNNILEVALLSIAPISELRGAIPLGILYGFNPLMVFLLSTLLNIAIIPIIFLFLGTINSGLMKIKIYEKFFHKVVEHSQKKIHKKVEKYGYLGLMIFVAIPLPITGAYTGTIGAWALGMDKKKSFVAIALGVIIAGIIVTIVSYFGINALNIFLK